MSSEPAGTTRSLVRERRCAALLSALVAIAVPGCDEPNAGAADAPDGLILEIDGLRCWGEELEPLMAYAESVDARIGRNARIATILDGHLIPLKLAQRAFAREREEQRRRAEALAAAIGNGGYPELVARATSTAAGAPLQVMRHDLPLLLAAWAFDETRLGTVSPVLETAQGFSLLSTYEITRGVTRTTDRAEVCQVAFFTHDSVAFGEWLAQSKGAVADRVTFLHSDYRGALPAWIKAP